MKTTQEVHAAVKQALALCDAHKIPVVLSDCELSLLRAGLYARSGSLLRYALEDLRVVTSAHSERRARQIDALLDSLVAQHETNPR